MCWLNDKEGFEKFNYAYFHFIKQLSLQKYGYQILVIKILVVKFE